MKGRWAAGIVPRNFSWIVKDELAVSERPGGYAPHHRRVRRREEILWLRAQGFTRVVSLLPSSHNLHAYEEFELPFSHFPLPLQGDVRSVLAACYPALFSWLRAGERILLHHEELGERVAGVAAGYLWWAGLLPSAPQAVSAVEHLLRRQMGSAGRSIVAATAELVPKGPGAATRAELTRREPDPPPLRRATRDEVSAAPRARARAHPAPGEPPPPTSPNAGAPAKRSPKSDTAGAKAAPEAPEAPAPSR